MSGKFFILDAGVEMEHFSTPISEQLRKDGNHVIYYLTDQPQLLCLEEVDEDTFLDHYKEYLKTNN